MNKLILILLVLVSTTTIVNGVEAQRNNDRVITDRGRTSNLSPNRINQHQRSFGNPVNQAGIGRQNNAANVDRAATYRRNDGRANALNNNRIVSTNQQRNQVAITENRGRNNSVGVVPPVYRQNNVSSQRNVRRNVYNNYNQYNNYANRGGYTNRGNYYNRGRYYPRFYGYGPRYRVIPGSFISISFGGYPYYYNNGLFFGSSGGYYQPLFPPPGIRISVLPFGYSSIFVRNNPFYYYNGIYYRQYRDQNNYEVVDPPMGATVSSLPKGAKSVVVNGEKLYELNGTYYKEDRNYKGKSVYTVVGKNGEINNTEGVPENTDSNSAPASLSNGDVINELPEGSKIVTINGEKLYVTPDDAYLKEEYDENIVQYKVVGK